MLQNQDFLCSQFMQIMLCKYFIMLQIFAIMLYYLHVRSVIHMSHSVISRRGTRFRQTVLYLHLLNLAVFSALSLDNEWSLSP